MKRIYFTIISFASLLGNFSYAQENASFANSKTNNQKVDNWVVKTMNRLGVETPIEGKNLPDSFMVVVFKGIDYNFRISYVESGHPEHNFIRQKTSLMIGEGRNTRFIRRTEGLKVREKLSSDVSYYIKQIKTASEYQDNNDPSNMVCIDPPLYGAFVGEGGIVKYYHIPNLCGNKTIMELRCKLDYDVSCMDVRLEEIETANTKRLQTQILNKQNN